jgi:Potential Queuosine, Q, salvage protein family
VPFRRSFDVSFSRPLSITGNTSSGSQTIYRNPDSRSITYEPSYSIPLPAHPKPSTIATFSQGISRAMSDDEADPELLALLRESLGLGPPSASAPPDTGVLKSAEYVYDNAVDVSISSQHTKAAARTVWQLMQHRNYSTQTWSEHELHPKSKDESTVNFIFTMNLLNFSFWSNKPNEERFAVDYKDHTWTGYWSLVAALQRALDEGK